MLRIWIFRRESAHEILSSVKNLELNLAGLGFQNVIDHRTARRVFGRGLLGRDGRARERVVIDAVGRGGMVEPERLRFCRVGRLPQRRDIIQNPKGASVRGHYEIIAMNGEIANGGDRQIELQRLPALAIIERNVSSEFGSGEEQPLAFGIFANRAQECGSGYAAGNRLPGSSIVTRSVEVRRLIVEAAAIYRGVGNRRIEMRSFDQ